MLSSLTTNLCPLAPSSIRFSPRLQKLCLTATVDYKKGSMAGILNGNTLPAPEFAGNASTLPMDASLWHRRLGHLNYEDIKRLKRKDLANWMILDLEDDPDPICEPCLAGKQHRVFNKSA